MSKMRMNLFLLVLGLWSCWHAVASNASDSAKRIEFGYQKDQDEMEDWSLDLTILIDDVSSFSAYFERSKVPFLDLNLSDPFAQELTDDLQSYGASYSRQWGEWEWGFNVGYWGDGRSIESHDFELGPNWILGDWRLGLVAIYRDMEFRLQSPTQPERFSIERVKGKGYGLKLGYTFSENWYLSLKANNYEYSGDLLESERFPLYTRLIFASDDSVLDQARGASLVYNFDLGLQSIGLSLQKNRAAFDEVTNNIIELDYQFPFNEYFDLRLIVGSGKVDGYDNFYYSGISLILIN